jgi:hypothetical protein
MEEQTNIAFKKNICGNLETPKKYKKKINKPVKNELSLFYNKFTY